MNKTREVGNKACNLVRSQTQPEVMDVELFSKGWEFGWGPQGNGRDNFSCVDSVVPPLRHSGKLGFMDGFRHVWFLLTTRVSKCKQNLLKYFYSISR